MAKPSYRHMAKTITAQHHTFTVCVAVARTEFYKLCYQQPNLNIIHIFACHIIA